MSVCSNCGAELDAGAKFCMECGTPVPQVKKCVQCGMELPLKAKFCFGCGAPQEGAVPTVGTGISMGDKNVVAGDVVGQKVAGDSVGNKIMGNAIYNINADETKKVVSCHVCGKHLTNVNGHTCPKCGNIVCDEHFDTKKNRCLNCLESDKQVALSQYESAIKAVLKNGRIDIIERNKLNNLSQSLGLSMQDVQAIEQKYKLRADIDPLTRVEKVKLDDIKSAFLEGRIKEYYNEIKNLFSQHPNNEDVVTWFLRYARIEEPEKTIDTIGKLSQVYCESYLSLVHIYILKNQIADAEIALNKAKSLWPDLPLVKMTEILFLMRLASETKQKAVLDEAQGVFDMLGEPCDQYEAYIRKNEEVFLLYLKGEKIDEKALYAEFIRLIDIGKVVAKDTDHLKQLIKDAIEKNGLQCDLNFIIVSNVTNMSRLFYESEFNGDISKWDVSNVTNMSEMFWGSKFNGDISKWDVSNVTNMKAMFCVTQFNEDISKWNVSNVTDMSGIFCTSQFNGDISKWDVSSVTDMSEMFHESQFNGDISNWNVSNVANMSRMFAGSADAFGDEITLNPFNGDISNWDVSNVTNMEDMFYASQFNGDISEWDVSNVTNMSRMFCGSPFNGDVSKWNVSNVTDMFAMFGESKFNGDISNWDVSNVTDMKAMFSESQFNRDISNWNVSNDTRMSSMFYKSALEKSGNIPAWYKE